MARLRRTSADQPGWTRRRAGKGWTYWDGAGVRLEGVDALRCKQLVIPPAWTDVWICPHANGHLQAVGTDAAGRRQYLYHPDWVAKRSVEKYDRVLELGGRIARLRERVELDLGLDTLDEAQACALAIRLIDVGYFRIGNDVYTAEHGSFGLTTLERRHVRRRGDALVFDFIGKSGVQHSIEVADPVAVEVLERMRRRRSRTDASLLAYREGRRWRSLTPGLVNEYLRTVVALEVSAKDLRTWHATVPRCRRPRRRP